jgi:hypothetical protein
MPRDIFGKIVKEDLLGNKIPKKAFKKEILLKNKAKGLAGEEIVKSKLQMQGWEVERSPIGKDFIARKRNFLTGKITQTKHIEVKTGKAKLSKLQDKTKKGKGKYQIIKENPLFY